MTWGDVTFDSFLRGLNAVVDYHNLTREKMASTIVSTKTPNKFVGFLDKVGHDFKVGLSKVLPVAATAGEVAVSILAPGASALFNQTIAAVLTAEQNAAAIGQQTGSGASKLAAVTQLMGGLIKQALADVGKPNDDVAVQKYVSAMVTILNAMPAPAAAAAAAPAPVVPAPSNPQPVATVTGLIKQALADGVSVTAASPSGEAGSSGSLVGAILG